MPDRGPLHRDENPRSIPVAELLAAHKRIRRIEPEPETELFVEALLPREEPASPPPPPVRAPQPVFVPVADRGRRHAPLLLGFAAAAAVLAGALVATHTVTKSHEPDAVRPAAAPESITGSKVFRPDLIKASLNDGGTYGQAADDAAAEAAAAEAANGQSAPEAGAQAQAGAVANGAVPAAPAQAGQPQAGQPQAGAPATTTRATQPLLPPLLNPPAPATTTTSTAGGGGLLGPILQPLDPITGPILGPILGFYATAPSQPTAAYQMLDPAMQDGDVDEFAQAWGDVTEAKVLTATLDGPDAMVVRVSLQRSDGSKLVTTQRIQVGSGPSPKIVGAQLLSGRIL